MGGGLSAALPMVIMVLLALALDFILGSKVYPSVSLLLVVFFLSKDQARSARHLNKEKKAKIGKIRPWSLRVAPKTWPKIGLLKAFMELYGALK